MIEEVGESRGEDEATLTTEVAPVEGMSGGDVVVEIQQDGDTAGGYPVKAKVNKPLIRRSEVVCLFFCLLI